MQLTFLAKRLGEEGLHSEQSPSLLSTNLEARKATPESTVRSDLLTGAVHSVVFAGFSAESLGDRLIDSRSRVLLTATGVLRGTKLVGLKQIVSLKLTPGRCEADCSCLSSSDHFHACGIFGYGPNVLKSEDKESV